VREADGDENDTTDDDDECGGGADGGNGGHAAGLGLRRWLVEEGRIVELNNQAKHAVSNWSNEVGSQHDVLSHTYDGGS
jgi:hypothetical protein